MLDEIGRGGVLPEERAVFESRVLREARAAGRLNDPAVVTVHDVLQVDDDTYIVMELVEAPTLATLVSAECPLPEDAVARLAEQLLSALEAAHTAGVVHRDVKPSNIMVLPDGRVKLTDFGIAQAADDTRLTSGGALVGSPAYMAPGTSAGRRSRRPIRPVGRRRRAVLCGRGIFAVRTTHCGSHHVRDPS